MRNIKSRQSPNDKIYTPDRVAKLMIEITDIKEDDIVLDPCRGGGVFYDNLPPCKKEYCEIEEDIDFFNYQGKPTVIIGNPPYSIWDRWLKKTLEINPEKICYIFGYGNLTPKRIGELNNAGYGIKKLMFLTIDWWFSCSWVVVFEKGYEGKQEIINIPKTIQCECGTRCGRGRTIKGVKQNPNKCLLKKDI